MKNVMTKTRTTNTPDGPFGYDKETETSGACYPRDRPRGGCGYHAECEASCQQAWAVPYCGNDNECVCLNKFATGKTSGGTQLWCGTKSECQWYSAWFGWQTQQYGYDCFGNACYPGYEWSTDGTSVTVSPVSNWACNTKCRAFIDSSGLFSQAEMLSRFDGNDPTPNDNVVGWVVNDGSTMDAHSCQCVIVQDDHTPLQAPYNNLKIAGEYTCQPPFHQDTCRHSGDLIPTNSYICDKGFGVAGSICIPQS
jgi:hypothetical protein